MQIVFAFRDEFWDSHLVIRQPFKPMETYPYSRIRSYSVLTNYTTVYIRGQKRPAYLFALLGSRRGIREILDDKANLVSRGTSGLPRRDDLDETLRAMERHKREQSRRWLRRLTRLFLSSWGWSPKPSVEDARSLPRSRRQKRRLKRRA